MRSHDTKGDKTNYTILGWINQWSVHPLIRMAIAAEYPEFIHAKRTSKNTWMH
jgi:hypothetical protein